MSRAIRRSLATFTIVALFAGVSATAANAGTDPTLALRDRVDAIGNRYFAAQAAARVLDAQMHALDQKLAVARRRAEALHPMAKAAAIQLYTSRTQSLTALFDVADAMESARHAELIARAGERTQGLLDRYMNATDVLERQRRELSRARTKQAKVVADLAKQESALEHTLAQVQQNYRDRLAAQAQARARAVVAAAASKQSATSGSTSASTATGPPTTIPPPPPTPVPIPPPSPPQTGVNPHHDDPFLVCTRTRESAGVYTAVNPAGYYGAYQFSQPTWDVTASHAGSPQLIGVRPDQASPWDQDQLAWVLYQWQGNGPWGGLC